MLFWNDAPEVDEISDSLVVEGVEALHDEDLGRGDGLRGVEQAAHVVVDRLLNALALLDRLDLLIPAKE